MTARKQAKGGARKRPSPAPARVTFERAHAAWLAARAVVWSFETAKHSEADMNAALDAMQEAQWLLIRTPAPTLCEIQQRAAFVQTLATDCAMSGRPTDNRDYAALAVLVTEIQQFTP